MTNILNDFEVVVNFGFERFPHREIAINCDHVEGCPSRKSFTSYIAPSQEEGPENDIVVDEFGQMSSIGT